MEGTKVKIFNENWEVLFKPQREIREDIKSEYDETKEFGRYYGATIYSRNAILIDKNLCTERKKRVLAHEVMHAILYVTATEREEYTTEDVCEIMAKYHEDLAKITDNVELERVEK